jgi:ankyrin repeat protein
VILGCIQLFDKKHLRLEQLKLLIAAGADINARDKHGSPPLLTSAMLNRYDMAYILLQAGADPKMISGIKTTVVDIIKMVPTNPKSEQYQ